MLKSRDITPICELNQNEAKRAARHYNKEVNPTDGQTNDINTTLSNPPTIEAPTELSSMCHSADNIGLKWIVLLEEVCVSRGWPIPTYETVLDSSEGVHVVFCRFHGYCEVGKAKKVVVARHLAARKMCSRFGAIPQKAKTISDNKISQCDLNGESTNMQLKDADDNSNTFSSIAESGVSGKVQAIGCIDSIPEPGVSGETEPMESDEYNISGSIPEPGVSDESKAMDTADTVKYVDNPIGDLQEICMSGGLPMPTYKIEADGPAHAPVYTVSCSLLNYLELGVGSKIKRAKKAAANKMLIRLQENPLDSSKISNNVSGCSSSHSTISNADYAIPNAGDSEDAVGLLQEICVSRGIPFPKYKMEADVGPAHLPIYTVSCSLNKYRTLGVGSNKKRAKCLAAHKMLTRLHENHN